MNAIDSMTAREVEEGLQRLVLLYEQMTPQRLDTLHSCYAADAHFKDPFNDVVGIESIRRIFAHMFSTVDAPRFVVTQRLLQGQNAFLAWEFHFRMRRWRKGVPQLIRGGTFIEFDAHGLVREHRDYWDAAQELYEKLPLLGALMRALRKMGAAPTAAGKS